MPIPVDRTGQDRRVPRPEPAGRAPSRTAGSPAPQDRRASPRHLALESRAWLGWGSAEDVRPVAAHLLDISRGGAALEAEALPPAGEPLWLCLDAGGAKLRVRARVVGIGPGPRGHQVRLAFDEPCPEDLLRLAVCGRRSHRGGPLSSRVIRTLRSLLDRPR
jgi:hypothetical protein